MTPMLAELETGGRVYRVHKLAAYPTAAHVAKRLVPFLGASGAALVGKQGETEADRQRAALAAVASTLSSIQDADHDFVLLALLGVVYRQEGQGLGWSPVANGGGIMAGDLELPQLYYLAGLSFWHNLGPFTDALPSDFKDMIRKASALFPG